MLNSLAINCGGYQYYNTPKCLREQSMEVTEELRYVS